MNVSYESNTNSALISRRPPLSGERKRVAVGAEKRGRSSRSTIVCTDDEHESSSSVSDSRSNNGGISKVRFDERISVRKFLVNPRTREDKAKLWYRKLELAKFRNEIRDIDKECQVASVFGKKIKAVEKRGIEKCICAKTNLESRRRYVTAKKAVFEEQSRQREQGVYNAKRIRQLYAKITLGACIEAQHLGKLDELVVSQEEEKQASGKTAKSKREERNNSSPIISAASTSSIQRLQRRDRRESM